MKRKIIVIGSPGAGKSTFARRLRDMTGLPLHYLDLLWHKPDRTNVSRDEFEAKLEEIFLTDLPRIHSQEPPQSVMKTT